MANENSMTHDEKSEIEIADGMEWEDSGGNVTEAGEVSMEADALLEPAKVSCESTPDTHISPPDMVKRIGSTTYEVSFHFSATSKETFQGKIARLIRRDLQNQ